MGRRRTTLRDKGGCLVIDVYKPDGKRTTISFGSTQDRRQSEIHAAFGRWLELLEKFPHRILSYSSPYEAIERILNPTSIVRVGEFFANYLAWMTESTPTLRDGRKAPAVAMTRRLDRFLKPYKDWPVAEELVALRQSMIDYRKAGDRP